MPAPSAAYQRLRQPSRLFICAGEGNLTSMTQPSFVPISDLDQVRHAYQLHVPGSWSADRPAEIRVPASVPGRRMGTPGPDQGFALQLAERFADRLVLAEGEHVEDVVAGCALVAARRAAMFGRAPCIHDVNAAFALWGFLSAAEPNVVDARKRLFRSVAHSYDAQRALVDGVDEALLRLPVDQILPGVASGVVGGGSSASAADGPA